MNGDTYEGVLQGNSVSIEVPYSILDNAQSIDGTVIDNYEDDGGIQGGDFDGSENNPNFPDASRNTAVNASKPPSSE